MHDWLVVNIIVRVLNFTSCHTCKDLLYNKTSRQKEMEPLAQLARYKMQPKQ